MPEALERVAGLQTQYAPAGYVALWSRLVDLPRRALTEALEARTAVQGTLMRSTIHTVSSADYGRFAVGIRRPRQEWFIRAWGKEIGGVDMDEVARFVRAELAGSPRRQADLQAAVVAHGWPRYAWVGVGAWLDMVRVPPSGTWERRKADLYGLADEWLEVSPDREPSEAEGIDHLVRRYLEGFGPAPIADAAAWAGVPAAILQESIDRLDRSSALLRYRDEQGRELLDLPGLPLPPEDVPAPVRFLPTWETMLLAHARRGDVLPEAYRPLVFDTKTPHSVETFTVDGRVAGTWRYEKGRVDVTPFAPIPAEVDREVRDEADRLTEFFRAG